MTLSDLQARIEERKIVSINDLHGEVLKMIDGAMKYFCVKYKDEYNNALQMKLHTHSVAMNMRLLLMSRMDTTTRSPPPFVIDLVDVEGNEESPENRKGRLAKSFLRNVGIIGLGEWNSEPLTSKELEALEPLPALKENVERQRTLMLHLEDIAGIAKEAGEALCKLRREVKDFVEHRRMLHSVIGSRWQLEDDKTKKSSRVSDVANL